MIKIFIPQLHREVIGGGWRFAKNFYDHSRDWLDFTHDPMNCDIYFIPGSTMVTDKYEPERAKANGAKIVLRLDNMPKDSNNKGCGPSRVKKYSKLADLIVYQSKWAKDYLKPFVKKDGVIILNGANTKIFKPDGEKFDTDPNDNVYLYSRSGRDENKGWDRARDYYKEIQQEDKNAILYICGNFGDITKYNFNFFMGERIKWLGLIQDPYQMAILYRTADWLLFPYFNDACSNTLIESILCGTMPIKNDMSGGNKEIIMAADKDINYLSAERMVKQYKKEFERMLNGKRY